MRLLLAVATVLLSVGPQTFKTSVEGVRVDVLVTRDSVPVTDLTLADFELRDNGVPQRIEAITVEDVPLDLALVLDVSASVDGAALTYLKEAATALVDVLEPTDRAALLPFSGTVRLTAGWTADRTAMRGAIAALSASGGTVLHDAAYAAMMLREPVARRQLVLVLSDGADTGSWLAGQTVVDVASRTDSVVYAVTLPGHDLSRFGYLVDVRSGTQAQLHRSGPGMLLRRSFLEALTTETGGSLLRTESRRLRETFLRVLREFRSRYVLTYTPRCVTGKGWHTLRVDVRRRGLTVSARRGYTR